MSLCSIVFRRAIIPSLPLKLKTHKLASLFLEI